MSEEDRPLTARDFFKYMDNLNKIVKEEVHQEVTAAIAPFREKQEEVVEDLSQMKDRVSAIEKESSTTKATIAQLQAQVQELRNGDPIPHPYPLPTTRPNLPPPPPHLRAPPSLVSGPGLDVFSDLASIVRDAKRTIGFSPIRKVDLDYLKVQHSITDDYEAMKASILEFLDCEMKVPHNIINSIVIRKIFTPAKQTEWDHLFVEFSDISTAELMYNYARNLRHGLSIFIYVPHCLHPRRTAINNIAYGYRNGTIKHNSKVKYGASDFVLFIKEKGSKGPWSNVSLDTESLPPPDFSSSVTSPPRGRIRLPSKRARPASDDSTPNRATKTRKEDLIQTNTEDISNLETGGSDQASNSNVLNEKATTKTPENTAQALASKIDLGAFLPSALLSPSTSLNKNFTFGADQSKMPNILSPLN